MYRARLLLKGFSYDEWEPEHVFDIHLEATVLELIRRDSAIELGRQILDVCKHARSEKHAMEMINQLKEMYLVGYKEQERGRKRLEHDKFVRLMEEGIVITSVTKEEAVGRMVTLNRHTGNPVE